MLRTRQLRLGGGLHTHLRQGGQNNNVVARDLVSDACLEALTVIALILSSIIYTHSPLPCNATVLTPVVLRIPLLKIKDPILNSAI